jgi:peptide/nickel transport system substrate-binding protein
VHQMLTLFYTQAAYVVLDYSPDLQGYRTDRFTGWIQQPAKIGPVIFSNTSPTYFNLKPISKTATTGSGKSATGTTKKSKSSSTSVILIVVVVVLILGGGGLLLRRRQTAAERE